MKRLIATCFGLGWMPLAPGSWGSLPPVAVFVALCLLPIPLWAAAAVMAALVVLASVLCVWLAPVSIAATGRQDPGEVVLDEVAGQLLTYLVCVAFAMDQFSLYQTLVTAAVGYFLFRLNDTLKPWPACRFERLPAGWGILCDDLAAGVYAAIELAIVLKLWIVA